MAKVKCLVCGEMFDREKIPNIKQGRRYMHVECADKVDDMARCCFCKEQFDKTTTPYVKAFFDKAIAHVHCKEAEDARPKSEWELFELYLMELFQTDFVPPNVLKQINLYYTKYNFTQKGIEQSLRYWTEVLKKTLISNSIGIVPSIYKDATKYYQVIENAQKVNEKKTFSEYVPGILEIQIPSPPRNIKKRQLFSFLDKEE